MTAARSPSHLRFDLPRRRRLITQRDFRRVYGRGSRARGAYLVVVAFRRRRPGFRLGVSVSKAHGGAVRRNKIKRIFREAFRLERPTLPGQFDIIMIPQARGRYPLDEVRSDLTRLIHELNRRPAAKRRGKPGRGKARGGKRRR